MKKTAQTSAKSGGRSHKRIPVLRMAGAAAVVAVIILMAVMFGMSFKGPGSDAPTLLIYGAEGQLPPAGFRNAVSAAGFDYDLVESTDAYKDGKLCIPDEYSKIDVVVMTVGDKGFDHVTAFAGMSNVHGFVLVCPDFPGNASMEGINSRNPACDIAVFAGRDDVDSVADVAGARLIYERISGDDTVYGSPIRDGGLFPSDRYISTEQNRYLSLSYFEYSDGNRMLMSPVFQKELADYLNVTYPDLVSGGIDDSRIVRWYTLSVMSVFFGIAAFALYFFSFGRRPNMSDRTGVKDAHISSRTYTVIASASAMAGMVSVVLSLFARTRDASHYLLLMSPLVVASLIMIVSIIRIGKADGKASAGQLISAVFMTASMSAYVILAALLFTDLSVDPSYLIGIVAVLTLIDAIVAGLTSYERRFGGLKFGDTLRLVGIMCIPGILAVFAGLITGNSSTVLWGLASVFAATVPTVVSVPVGRHSSSFVCTGVVHGVTYLMIMLALL